CRSRVQYPLPGGVDLRIQNAAPGRAGRRCLSGADAAERSSLEGLQLNGRKLQDSESQVSSSRRRDVSERHSEPRLPREVAVTPPGRSQRSCLQLETFSLTAFCRSVA